MPRRCYIPALLLVAAWPVGAQSGPDANPVLGVVTSARTFAIGPVEQKPESGPIPVVDGDRVSSTNAAVMFRLNGQNRTVLAAGSEARVRHFQNDGVYFYLTRGSIQFEAREELLAICARDRLYIPSTPGSGEILIQGSKVQVRLTSGTMVRNGSEACNVNAVPLLLTNASGATAAGTAVAAGGVTAGAGAGTAAGAAATVTATATAAGVGAAVPVAAGVAGIAVATASAAGVIAATVTAIPPASQSPITPGQ